MNLLRAQTTVRRYRILGDPPDPRSKEFAERLKKHAFRPRTVADEEGETCGWIGPSHLFDDDLSPERLMIGPYVVLTFRIDRVRVPRALLTGHIKMEEVAWKKANGKTEIPPAARREIREEVRRRLLRQVLPSSASYDAFYNPAYDVIYFTSRARGVNDAFRAHFRQTFDRPLEPVGPFGAAARLLSAEGERFERLVAAEPTPFVAAEAAAPAGK